MGMKNGDVRRTYDRNSHPQLYKIPPTSLVSASALLGRLYVFAVPLVSIVFPVPVFLHRTQARAEPAGLQLDRDLLVYSRCG